MKNGNPSGNAKAQPACFRSIGFSRIFRRLIGCIAIIFSLARFSVPAAVLPPGFVEVQFGGNLGGTPTAMDFAPDGRLFVCLQAGQLRVIEHGVLLTDPFVTVTTTALGERGLLGIAFDPNFASNQFVYVYYTVPTAPIHNRVSRFTANGNVAVPGSETPILELDNLSAASNHNGGAIHFGPDGKLYVAVGENANPSNSQSLSNRLGKVLRINSDGTIPADNPTSFPGIAGSPTGDNRAIWAVGLRNPFTFGFQPGTGRLFINDVGAGSFEEINDGIAGSNYGWSICEGFCSPPNPNFRDPLFAYGHGEGCAIVGGAFYNPAFNQFPPFYTGKYFFGDLCSGWIHLFDPSSGTASDFATGITFLVDLKVGPGGSLYYLAQGNNGQVWKISATPAPTPTASPTPTSTPTPTPATPSPTATVPPTPTPTPASPTPTPTATVTPTPSEGPRADVGVNIADAPDPVQVGQNLTYNITVFVNVLGPGGAPNVTMYDALPASVNLVSVTPSRGTCDSTITCHLGDFPFGGTATVILVVTPTVSGPLSNTASAFSVVFDPFQSNNVFTATTTVML